MMTTASAMAPSTNEMKKTIEKKEKKKPSRWPIRATLIFANNSNEYENLHVFCFLPFACASFLELLLSNLVDLIAFEILNSILYFNKNSFDLQCFA